MRRNFILVGRAVCLACLLAGPARADDWKVLKQQGRDYVSFANVAEFYRFPNYTRASRSVSLKGERRSIQAQAGLSEIFLNGVKFVTDFPILATNNDELVSAMDVRKIIEPVLRPSKIQGARKVETVVLDPGHGGTDQGASNSWGTEKVFALDVALAAREELLRAGMKVEMTRSTDVGLSLEDRVNFANQFPNAVFISIHFNSSSGGSGLESYALAPCGVMSNASNESHVSAADVQWYQGNAQDEQNVALAAAVHASVLSRVALFDRGVRHARFHVLRNCKIPATLIEGGFLSNAYEGRRIATPAFRQQLGVAIAQAIKSYNSAVNFRSPSQAMLAARNPPPHEKSINDPLNDEPSPAHQNADQPSIVIDGAE